VILVKNSKDRLFLMWISKGLAKIEPMTRHADEVL
jgi:hypothetical protein